MQVERVTPAIGAEITGIDLSSKLDQATLDEIYRTLLDCLVIFFPDQNLSAAEQLEFAKTFGPIDKPHAVYRHVGGYPQVTLLESDANEVPGTDEWHSDLTFYPNPPFAAILHAREIPPNGGDTLWASMYAAYDALPSAMKTLIEELEAIHDPGTFKNQFLGAERNIAALNAAMSTVGSAVHPIVKINPMTEKAYLYVNASFTRHVVDVSEQESNRLLHYLCDHIDQPEFQVRHRWREGDVTIWDNRVTQHYAVADYFPQYRRMHRVTVVRDGRDSVSSDDQKA